MIHNTNFKVTLPVIKQLIAETINEHFETINENERPLSDRQRALIEKWVNEMGTRKAAIKMIDSILKSKLGIGTDDLPDTSTFADGVDSVEEALQQSDYVGAYNIAHDTAQSMVEEEGGDDLLECGDWNEAVKHPMFKEAILKEKAPPGMEKWVKSNKQRFKSQYGDKKGTGVLYATAWKMFYKNKKKVTSEAKKVKKALPLTKFAIDYSVPAADIASADQKVQQEPIGYVTHPDDPVPTKTPIYAFYPDKGNLHCYIVLQKHVDGSGVFVRELKQFVNIK